MSFFEQFLVWNLEQFLWVLAAALIALHGAGLVFGVALVRTTRPGLDVRRLRLYLSLLAAGCVGFGAVLFVAVALRLLAASTAFDSLEPEQGFVLAGYGMVAVLTAAAGLSLFWVNRALGRRLSIYEERTLHHALTALTVLGWTLLAVAILPLGLILFLLAALPLFLATAGVVVAANRRRTRQGNLLWLLAVAVEKRLPLPDELESHATTVWGTPRVRVRELAQELRSGVPLHEALLEFPGLLPQQAVLAARVGTESGSLGPALREAAVRHTQAYSGAYGIKSPAWFFIYGWSLVLVIFNIVAFLMYYIVPKLKKIFEDFGIELPAVTEALIVVSDVIEFYWYLLSPLFFLPLLVLIGAGVGFYVGWADIRSPFVTRWFPRFDTPGVLRTLARTIRAGQPLQTGLTQLAAFHHRWNIRQSLAEAAQADEQGGDLWLVLMSERLIDQRELAVLSAAARLGNLPWALDSLAENIEGRQRYRLYWWIDLLQPVVVLALGLVVLFINVGFFMPLVKLLNDLS